jgi:hypothetical protein
MGVFLGVSEGPRRWALAFVDRPEYACTAITITADRQDKKLEGYHLRATVAGVSDRVDGYIARRADGQWDVRARAGLHVNLRRLGLFQTRRHALNNFERFAETALKATTVSGTLVGKGGPVPPA